MRDGDAVKTFDQRVSCCFNCTETSITIFIFFSHHPQVGKDFDALLIDAEAHNSPFDCFDRDNTMVCLILYLRILYFYTIRGCFFFGIFNASVEASVRT